VISYGLYQPAEISADNIDCNDQGQPRFRLMTPDHSQRVQLPLAGEHQVHNALAAASVAYCLNVSLAQVAQGLSQAQTPAHRLMVKSGPGASQIIDDCYNANPESTQAALKFLARFSGCRIAVLGDMKELGEQNGSTLHRQIGAFASSLGIDELFTIGEYGKQLAQDFARSSVFTDKSSLYQALLDKLSDSTTVLIKGSRSLQLETLVDKVVGQTSVEQS
jgi:UDP-N-acetylmuramoyl-tripeptide--D-alanyl-D-alanine ligase